jgi:hypothetical protein
MSPVGAVRRWPASGCVFAAPVMLVRDTLQLRRGVRKPRRFAPKHSLRVCAEVRLAGLSELGQLGIALSFFCDEGGQANSWFRAARGWLSVIVVSAGVPDDPDFAISPKALAMLHHALMRAQRAIRPQPEQDEAGALIGWSRRGCPPPCRAKRRNPVRPAGWGRAWPLVSRFWLCRNHGAGTLHPGIKSHNRRNEAMSDAT